MTSVKMVALHALNLAIFTKFEISEFLKRHQTVVFLVPPFLLVVKTKSRSICLAANVGQKYR